MSLETIRPDSVGGFAPLEIIKNIQQAGFTIKTQRPLADVLAESTKKVGSFPYKTYAEVQTTLENLASTYSFASLFSMGKSLQGRELWTLRLNTTAQGMQPSSKPGCVLMATIHTREHLATVFALRLAEYLCSNYDSTLQQLDIYITPLWNPDGNEYDLSGNPYRCYRKNMRINPDRSIGVDLNRNFGFVWGSTGASAVFTSDTYRGPYPFSEPETKAFKQFIEHRNNIKTFASYHTYGELIIYPWGHTSAPLQNSLDRRVHVTLARNMAKITGYTPQQASKLYLTSGDAVDWTYGARGIISFTLELIPQLYGQIGCSGFYPTNQTIIDDAIAKNIDAALYLLNITANPYKSIPIDDECYEDEIVV